MNSTIFSDNKVCTRSWWCERKPDGTPYNRAEWQAEWERQVRERMLLSNPPIPTARDLPSTYENIRRSRVPSTL